METTVTVTYNADPKRPFSFRGYLDRLHCAEGMLTDEHPASSRGLPVVVIAGRAYGPADLAEHVLAYLTRTEAEWAQRAGWRVSTPCPQCAVCGAALDGPRTWETVYCWQHDQASTQ